jgi:uncharacterized protein (DUF2147 family)
MRKFLAVAVLALLANPAHAREVHEFTFGRHVVRIEVPKHCKRPSCVQVYGRETLSGKSRKASESSTAPAATETVATRSAGTATTTTTAAKEPARTASQPSQGGAQNNAAAQSTAGRSEPASESELDGRKATARLSLPGSPAADGNKVVVASNANAATAAAPKDEPVKADAAKVDAAKVDAAKVDTAKADTAKADTAKGEPSPIGLWQTEGNQGRVRIEACGQALCGHTEGKPNEKVLIDMVKATSTRWNGRINDIRNGRVYTSFIQLKSANSLRVEGCAFGGLFCGGETWARVQ